MTGTTAFAADRPSDINDNAKYHEMLKDGTFSEIGSSSTSSTGSWKGIDNENNSITNVEVQTYNNYVTTAPTQPGYYQESSAYVLELNGYSGYYPETIYQKVRVIPGSKVYISYQYAKRTVETNSDIVQQMLLSVVPASSFNGTTTVYTETNLNRDIFKNNKLTDVTVHSGDATVSDGIITAGNSWSEIYAEYNVPSDVYEVYVAFHGVAPTGSPGPNDTTNNTSAVGNILAYASARTATIDKVYVSSSGSDASGNGSESSPFNSLEVASYWVSEGGTIVLLDNVSQDMTADKEFTLDLNGNTVTGDLSVNSTGNLTITDSSTAQTGKITGNVTSASGSEVNIDSGRIEGTLSLNGTASITGGTFKPKPSVSYIASGYECVENNDGSYTVKKTSDIKSSAITEIEQALSDTKTAINNMTGTDDEKNTLIAEAEAAYNSAKSAINSASSAAGIENAKTSGIDALKQIADKADLQNAKNEAADAIDKAVTANKATIDALENLSNDEKTALKNELDNAAAKAKTAINDAASTDAVSTAQSTGIDDLDLLNAKAEAIDAVNKKLADETDAVNGLENLSDSEKEELISDLNTAAAKAKTAINDAVSTDAVSTAQSTGIDDLDLLNAKAEAIDAVNKKLADETDAVNGLENLSDSEKEELISDLNTAAAKAKTAINDAASANAVDGAKTSGIANMDLLNAKAEAIDAVNKKLADETDAVNGLENLSDSEKEELISDLNTAAAKAKTAINDAASANAVDGAKDDGIAVLELNKVRATTTDEINRKLAETLAAIDALEYLNSEEKAVQKAAAKDAADTANAAVSNAGADDLAGILETLSESLKDVMDNAISADFIDAYLNDNADGTVYDDVNSANIDRILSGQEPWNDLTDKQKEIVNQTIAALNEEKTDVRYQTYQDYLDAVVAAIEDSKTSFIEQYVSDEQGNIYKEATVNNYEQLFSGKETWDELSQAEKDAIDEALVAAGSKPYEELLKEAEDAVDSSANDFIDKYVSDDRKNIYKSADKENYRQILSGEDVWNSLTQSERDAINRVLLADGGKSYEELLDEAINIEALVNSPKTGDSSNIMMWFILMIVSGFGLIAVSAIRRKESAN